MNIYFITFGCKVNIYETAALKEAFAANGFTAVTDKSSADIIVVNSCTVTSESDSKLRQALRRIKRENPLAVTVLTGCYPQAFPERAANEAADIVTGNKDKLSVVRLVKEYTQSTGARLPVRSIIPYSGRDRFEELFVSSFDDHTRGFLKIQDGCCSGCTYCVIPRARGKIRSKPLPDIAREARALVRSGCSEIVFVGINLGFYGADCGLTLADAAETVCRESGALRVRIGSLEPERLTENELMRLSRLKTLCPSFHLSLQSGCNRTLAAMNRRYTAEEYYALTRRIRSLFPDCGITADVMTGFPGETEADHKESLSFVKSVGFSDIHVFPFSAREGTAAAAMPRQLPAEIKRQRAAEMLSVRAECRREFLEKMKGRVFPVLFEREKADGVHHGYTPNYINVRILTKYSEKSLRKMIFYVKIDIIGDDCCYGDILDSSCANSSGTSFSGEDLLTEGE